MEFVLTIPIFAVLLIAIMFTTRYFMAKLFLMQVVREGYLAMVYADLSKPQTEQFLYARFDEKAKAFFPPGKFYVRARKRQGLLNIQPSYVKAEGELALSGLSLTILGSRPIVVKAQLYGFAGTGSGGQFLTRATRELSKLFRTAGLPIGG